MRSSSIAMSSVMLAVFGAMTAIALLAYPEGARAQPLIIGVPAIALCILQLAIDLRQPSTNTCEQPMAETPIRAASEPAPAPAREARVWCWFIALVSSVLLAGFWVAVPAFLVGFLLIEARTGAARAFGLGLGATAALYCVFGLLLKASLHDGFLIHWLKG